MKYVNLILGVMGIITAIICLYEGTRYEFWAFLAVGFANLELYKLKNEKDYSRN